MNEHYIDKHKLKVPGKIDLETGILNGNLYCAHRRAKSCLPIDNRIICQCEENEIWNSNTQFCEKFDSCAYIYCSENEECYEDRRTKKSECRCKANYYRNEATNECEVDYCRAEKIKQKCSETEVCINDLINERAICQCRYGFGSFKHLPECIPLFPNEQQKTPFIGQYYNCDHTYELSPTNKYRCKCFDGYQLQDDQKTCKPEFDIKKCPLCNVKEVCVRPDPKFPFKTKCVCKLGYSEGDKEKPCEPNFCNDPSAKMLIKHSCETSDDCSWSMVRREEPVFKCNCKPELAIANSQHGICELKNVCNKIEQDKCAETNAYCVPRLDGNLSPVCECSVGFGKDPATNDCVPLDELLDCKRFNAFTKYIDVKKNRAICTCLPGYEFNQAQKKCILSWKDTVQVSVTVFLKHVNDELDKEEIPASAYGEHEQAKKGAPNKIYDCNTTKLLSKENCYASTNEAYQQLVEMDKALMMKNVEYHLYQKTRSLFYYIQGDEEMSISMIGFANTTEIDEKQYGFNTTYLVNVALVGENVNGDNLQKNLNKLCQEEEKANDGNVKPDEFKDFCYFDKRILPVSRRLSATGSLNLCNLKTMQCPAYSSCKHDKNGTENAYSCVCNKGFKSLHKIEEYNLNIEVCEDLDECNEDGGTHECGPNTICDNLIGSYRCICKENFKRLNDTDCEGKQNDPIGHFNQMKLIIFFLIFLYHYRNLFFIISLCEW